MLRIGMLTQWFDPEPGPAALPGIYAREFVKQGHEVKVLTGFPNYPDGELYPGYAIRPRAKEGSAPLSITRVALYPNHGRSAVRRLVNYASFGASAATLGAGALRGADAIWVYNSPITVALPLLTSSGFGRTPIFLHVQDIWPDSLLESGMLPDGRLSRVAAGVISSIVRLVERRSAVVGVISKSARQLILERNPKLDSSKVVFCPNPTNETLFVPMPQLREQRASEEHRSEPVEFMYAGAIGDVQGLDTIIETAALLKGRSDVVFTFLGDGISRSRLEARVEQLGLTNVKFLGRVPQDQVPTHMARADVQLVSLAPLPFLRYTMPSKIASLLASQVPIVALLQGDGADLLRESGAATVVEPGDPRALALAVVAMAEAGSAHRDAMALHGRRYYEAELSAPAAAATITRALAEVAN